LVCDANLKSAAGFHGFQRVRDKVQNNLLHLLQ
jgi:hypothetical protein